VPHNELEEYTDVSAGVAEMLAAIEAGW
jgi:hypothetical protein